MIDKTDLRIISLIIDKCNKLIKIVNEHTIEEIESDFTLSDALQFEFEKLYEDSNRLSPFFKMQYNFIPFDKLRGIRNRVAHDYESVILEVLISTCKNDIPVLKEQLEKII